MLIRAFEILEGRASAWPPAGRDVAHQPFGFHDPHVRLLGDRDQIVGRVAGDEAARAPVIRQADLVNRCGRSTRSDGMRGGHERARFDDAARRGDA